MEMALKPKLGHFFPLALCLLLMKLLWLKDFFKVNWAHLHQGIPKECEDPF